MCHRQKDLGTTSSACRVAWGSAAEGVSGHCRYAAEGVSCKKNKNRIRAELSLQEEPRMQQPP